MQLKLFIAIIITAICQIVSTSLVRADASQIERLVSQEKLTSTIDSTRRSTETWKTYQPG